MSERPILFSGPMVRAILDGRKTQTRRILKAPKWCGDWRCTGTAMEPVIEEYAEGPMTICADTGCLAAIPCPYGKPGDRLWVRETFCPFTTKVYTREGTTESAPKAIYKTDGGFLLNGYKWKPSIHMPRWASRITLEITEVRVERLREIEDEDICAEGIGNPTAEAMWGSRWWVGAPEPVLLASRFAFQTLWESINGPGSWDANPWVWAVSFQRVEQESAAEKGRAL